jgi:type III pantothenate kinase
MFAKGGRMKLTTTVDEPDLIGVDRLVTSLAAYTLANSDVSVVAVDVGTAMTVDFVKADGTHVGGAILPGPETMTRSLHEATAKLPLVPINPRLPSRGWGTNTNDAIELGIARAILGAADQLILEWSYQAGDQPAVFATGGNADYFAEFKFTANISEFAINPALTLEGIRLAAEALP